jgi:hypothetical protein
MRIRRGWIPARQSASLLGHRGRATGCSPHRAAVALARVLDRGFGFALIRIARPSG